MKTTFSTILIVLIFLSFNNTLHAQVKAITENGDSIFVYNNGTWSYDLLDEGQSQSVQDFLSIELDIDTLDTEFSVPKKAKKMVKSENTDVTFNYDSSIWKRIPAASLNADAEIAFQSNNPDLWCLVITEEIEIDPDVLFRIAKKTMEDNTGGKAEILKTEVRIVNGSEVVRGVLRIKMAGIVFVFDSYYYSDYKGSVQFTTWTSESVYNKNKQVALDLLNGFMVK